MFTVALTGGIASGKSTVAHYFSELGVPVIDTDQIAHQVARDPSVIRKIVAYFGPSVLTTDKQLHRPLLRELAFSDARAHAFLEQLLHPLIYHELQASIARVHSIYCLLLIPLLFEGRNTSLLREKPISGLSIVLNRIMLVISSEALQIQRAQARDHLTQKQVRAILALQNLPAENFNKANDIIYNKAGLDDLRDTVIRFHRMYLSFSHTKNILLEQLTFLHYHPSL